MVLGVLVFASPRTPSDAHAPHRLARKAILRCLALAGMARGRAATSQTPGDVRAASGRNRRHSAAICDSSAAIHTSSALIRASPALNFTASAGIRASWTGIRALSARIRAALIPIVAAARAEKSSARPDVAAVKGANQRARPLVAAARLKKSAARPEISSARPKNVAARPVVAAARTDDFRAGSRKSAGICSKWRCGAETKFRFRRRMLRGHGGRRYRSIFELGRRQGPGPALPLSCAAFGTVHAIQFFRRRTCYVCGARRGHALTRFHTNV